MKRSLVVLLTIAVLLFAFAGLAVAAEQDTAADRLKGFGIVEGYPDGSMGLERDITRAEFAKIAVLAKGMGEAAALLQGSASQFSDVQTNVWYTGWINVAASNGIVKGDPAGTFRPNDNISNAEAVAMILRVLGYNDNLPGAWPMNYLVKGAELGITTGVVTNANAKAVRGEVFTMLNRALDKEVVRWSSDDAEFKNRDGNYTLLQEMLNAKEESEGRVVNNFRTKSSLKENEIEIDTATGKFKVMVDVDVDWLLGLEVTLKHNKDKEVFYVEVDTAASDIILDTVKGFASNEVELLVKDKKYDVDGDVLVNFDDGTLAQGQYGKFVLEDGDVVFAVVFEFERFAGLVTEVDGDIIVYIDETDKDAELHLDEYDDVYVFDAKLGALDVDVINVDSVIYYWEDGSDAVYIVVVNESVEGTLTRVRSGDVRVDGKDYKTIPSYFGMTTVSDNDNSDVEEFNIGSGGRVLNLVNENVVIYLDLNGRARHIMGDSEATSGAIYGLAVDAYRTGADYVLRVFNSEGKEVVYPFKNRSAWQPYFDYFDGGKEVFIPVRFELNKDGEITDNIMNAAEVVNPSHGIPGLNATGKTFDKLIEIDGSLGEVILHKNNYIRAQVTTNVWRNFNIGSSTVMMKYDASSASDQDEDLVTWASIKDTEVNNADFKIVGYGDPGKAANLIVIYSGYNLISSTDNFFGVVAENRFYDGDDWISTVAVTGEGTKEYIYNGAALKKGDLVEFRVSTDGEMTIDDLVTIDSLYGGVSSWVYVTGRSGDSIRISSTPTGGDWEIMDADVVIYRAKWKSDAQTELEIEGTATKAQLNGYRAIYLEEEGVIKAIIRLPRP